jgi:hypothetical protein
MYRNEVRFYRDVRPELAIEVRQAFASVMDEATGQLREALWKVQGILDSEPTTLLHGDTQIGNPYLLVTALDPEERRKHERDLIAIHLGEPRRRGVEAPEQSEAWLLQRQAVVWGLVIGWLITPPENYGQEITATNVSRLVTAARNLETFRALTRACREHEGVVAPGYSTQPIARSSCSVASPTCSRRSSSFTYRKRSPSQRASSLPPAGCARTRWRGSR